MKRSWLSVLGALIVAAALVPAVPASAAPYCGLTWGSLPESTPDYHLVQLTNARTGRHDCYDRVVFDLNGPASGYDVRYVDQLVADGSGQVIPLAGGAKLAIMLKAAAYDDAGRLTYPGVVTGRTLPGVNVAGYSTFRDTKFAGSFEGQTTLGVGVRAKLPFRVLRLDNRVMLDVAHFW